MELYYFRVVVPRSYFFFKELSPKPAYFFYEGISSKSPVKCIPFILLPGNGGFREKISICVPSVVQIRNVKEEQRAAHDTQNGKEAHQ